MSARRTVLRAGYVTGIALLLAGCDATEPEFPEPAAIEATAGADARVQVASELGLSAKVTDASGDPVHGVGVQWSIVSGGGSLSTASNTTDRSGRAGTLWTVGTVAGTGEVRASVRGLGAVSFQATLLPGPPVLLDVAPDTVTLFALGDTTRFAATSQDEYGNQATDQAPTWHSTDSTVVTVDSAGLATAVANGGARVIATTEALLDSASVTVEQQATTVFLTPTNVVLTAAGDTVRLHATATDGNGHEISEISAAWSSTDSAVATVSAGLVEAVAGGTAHIVADMDPTADTVAVAVFTDRGIARTWQGTHGSTWADPLGWMPAGAANGLDTATVAATALAMPVLSAPATLAGLVLESGATLDLAAHSLTVAGDVTAEGVISATAGFLALTGPGEVLGTLPGVQVDSVVNLAGPTTITGTLRVPGGRITTQGQALTLKEP